MLYCLYLPVNFFTGASPQRRVGGFDALHICSYNGPCQHHSADMGRWRSLLNVWASFRRHSVVAPLELCVIDYVICDD
jgi:hypothetical protein